MKLKASHRICCREWTITILQKLCDLLHKLPFKAARRLHAQVGKVSYLCGSHPTILLVLVLEYVLLYILWFLSHAFSIENDVASSFISVPLASLESSDLLTNSIAGKEHVSIMCRVHGFCLKQFSSCICYLLTTCTIF
ncbi:hypothetical protein O6H91_09G004500 [Diphasiastrum complanatum]|uniref:Uncharacterized protein n=1 Tax=Diphasiastrum complanatum TaxID=34168 RepID=A0ACC2CKW8_DIPCM|nr:hypothetical protein O6H91_09G004500 [Diphasiastrum complanatum]